jgi:hydrogenase expression/formation protein HypD
LKQTEEKREMDDLSGFRDSDAVGRLARSIEEAYPGGTHRLMEVCGTHTMAIARYGLRSLLPRGLALLSGPGCPVCVTPSAVIDAAVKLAERPDTAVVTFGDMMSVPGSRKSLELKKAEGADIRVLYSVYDMLHMAKEEPQKDFVFISVGFETTTPGIALSVIETKRRGLGNVCFLAANRLVIPAMDALMKAEEVRIDGFLCPGHVSVIIGSDAYRSFSHQYRVPCVVAGFEPVDILLAICDLAGQIGEKRHEVTNRYSRAVTPEGNTEAQRVTSVVFEAVEAEWRGIGRIPKSGLSLRPEFREFDALERYELEMVSVPDPPGCRCGDVLKGLILPPQCGLFGKRCTPQHPVGPCMVSSEGSCAAYFKYENI